MRVSRLSSAKWESSMCIGILGEIPLILPSSALEFTKLCWLIIGKSVYVNGRKVSRYYPHSILLLLQIFSTSKIYISLILLSNSLIKKGLFFTASGIEAHLKSHSMIYIYKQIFLFLTYNIFLSILYQLFRGAKFSKFAYVVICESMVDHLYF